MKRFVLVFLTVLACISPVFAADDSMYIDSYSVNVDVGQNNVFAVSEDISMMYLTPHHGFFRDIPLDYTGTTDARGRVIQVSGFSCSDEWSADYNNGYYSVRIGSADSMVSGPRNYRLSYNYDVGEDVCEGYDEVYFNLVGPDWACPIRDFSFRVNLPVPFDEPVSNVWVNKGTWGSTSSDGVQYSVSPDGLSVSGFVPFLYPGETLTVRIQLPDGYFVGARHVVNYTLYARYAFFPVCALMLLLALLIRRRNKSDRVFVPVTSFNPPDGMSPMEVGYFVDGMAETKDFVSMYYYWADKGLLEIEESGKDYLIKKLKDIDYECTSTEKYLFREFTKGSDNEQVSLKSMAEGLFSAVNAAKQMIAGEFKGEKSKFVRKSVAMSFVPALMAVVLFASHASLVLSQGFDIAGMLFSFLFMLLPALIVTSVPFAVLRLASSKKYTMSRGGKVALWIFIAFFALVIFAVSFSIDCLNDVASTGLIGFTSFAFAVTYTALCIISSDVRRFTEYGHSKMEMIVGFRDYINKVEIDPLKRLFSENPSVFYRILPYAMVLGLEKTLSKKLEGIPIPPPSWYVGSNMSTYSVMRMAHMSSMVNRELSSVASRSSGSHGGPSSRPGSGFGGGGFGGGGFAGGGFGGGGGRGW